MVIKYLYSVWFVDIKAFADDQDREWVACIGIEAVSNKEAQEWGDTLADEFAQRSGRHTFLRSSLEKENEVDGVTDWSTLPRIKAGETPEESLIGW